MNTENTENIRLTKEESRFVMIPEKLILNTQLDLERVAAYSWLRINSLITIKTKWTEWTDLNFDNVNSFNIISTVIYDRKLFCEWLGHNPLSKTGKKTNPIERAEAVLNDFEKMDVFTNVKHIRYYTKSAEFNEIKDNRFVIVYLDEINKIVNTKSQRFGRVNKAITILVLAYLRLKIPCSNSKYGYYFNEAYNTFYRTIGKDIGVDYKRVKKSVEFLYDLGIIYVEDYGYISGRFELTTHIFTNMYKRNKDMLLESGEDYYKPIVESKRKALDKILKKVIINGETISKEEIGSMEELLNGYET